MIDSITGIMQRKEPTNLFIDMNGLVLNISICLKDYEDLPDLNQEITILTYLNVREDLMELYGFLENDRRNLFIQLIGVSGIGPRTAINLLSNISVAHFKENIIAEDVKSLSLIPGIGPKTAKRIILDIRLFVIVLMVRTLRIELRLKVFQTFVPTTYTRFANLTRTFSYISI